MSILQLIMNKKLTILVLALSIMTFYLAKGKGKKIMDKVGLSPLDPSSYSRPEHAIVTFMKMNLTVNFDRKVISGNVDLDVKKVEETANEVIFDTSKLTIFSIYDVETKEELKYTLSEPIEEFGSKLVVALPKNDNKSFKIGVKYETSPEATGLQWLPPSATMGKKHPFLFTQFQPIHARSVLPCQDTPAVKTKYEAVITTPKQYRILMSAISDGIDVQPDCHREKFKQDVPVPSYLIALAVGDITNGTDAQGKSRIWAEKDIITKCSYEFAETTAQLEVAKSICGPYEWGIYDLLVLPPSFPYGGMENPCLTFVTPTLLAGDRSLANVIAHEIAHSWTGNLITNRNFEHFWLNEGFTVFIERKIKGRLESPQSQDFDAYIHVRELNETINRMGKDNPLTQLVVDLRGVHPDDAFSTVPYEKGFTFLRYLEDLVGGPAIFEPFLREYFQTFKFKSIDTDDFKSFFDNYFKNNSVIKTIDWKTWLHAPGMPPVIPNYDKTLAIFCDEIIEKFLKWDGQNGIPISKDDQEKLITSQTIYILQVISEAERQSVQKLKALNDLFKFDGVENAEIKFRWLRICLKAHWEEKVQPVLGWLNTIGRMKYVRPLYRDLYDWEEMRSKAVENFKANRQYMMHVSAYTLAKDLHVDS